MKKSYESKNGITLIALVITIIILIILAGISISVMFGENGLIEKAKQGATNYREEADKEELVLMWQSYQIDSMGTEQSFIEYLISKGYDVEQSESNSKAGTVVIGTKKYTFDTTSGSLSIEYDGTSSSTSGGTLYVSTINLSERSKIIGLSTATINISSVESSRTGVEPTDSSVTWSTSDASKVRIDSQTDSSVTITGLASTDGGTVAITATANDGSGVTAICNVEVFSGTIITSVEQFKALCASTITSGSYKLAVDLDLDGHTSKGFGGNNDTQKFSGTFDGGGHTIENWNITYEDSGHCGFIPYCWDATLKNLTLKNINLIGIYDSYTAFLARW